MFRSEKIKIKKEKKMDVVDQKTKDYQTFLGDISALLLQDQPATSPAENKNWIINKKNN